MSKFTDVWAGKKYSVMLALTFPTNSPQKSGVYSVSKSDLETVIKGYPSYFDTCPMHVLTARLDNMGADVCSDATNMIRAVLKDREPICVFDSVLV